MYEMRGVLAVHAHFKYWGQLSTRQEGANGDVQMISCDSGTKLSLGPNSYFTGGLIYSQNLTLGYVLLVPPMLLTVTLANRQVICISTLPHPLYS